MALGFRLQGLGQTCFFWVLGLGLFRVWVAGLRANMGIGFKAYRFRL